MGEEVTRMKWDLRNYEISYSAMSGTSDSYDFVGSLDENMPSGFIVGIFGRIVTPFAGIKGPLNMEIGTSGDTDMIMPKFNLIGARANQRLFTRASQEDGPWETAAQCMNALNYAYNTSQLRITLTSESGSMSNLTAGRVDIVIASLIPA